jgi:hypothetical protein
MLPVFKDSRSAWIDFLFTFLASQLFPKWIDSMARGEINYRFSRRKVRPGYKREIRTI